MSIKYIVGKTIFFMLLVGFIMLFSLAFGQDNVLIGVMVVVAALMMIPRDLSTRPVMNLSGLIALNLTLGIGAYMSLINPWTGIFINFSVVFVTTYVLMHNLRSSVYFPFLLGYAFILSMPVPAEGLPLRFVSLVAGALFIFVLNVLINRKGRSAPLKGISGLLEALSEIARERAKGKDVDITSIEKMSKDIISMMHWKVKDNYYTSSTNQSMVGMAVGLRMIARQVKNGDHSEKSLIELADLLQFIKGDNITSVEEVHSAIAEYIGKHPFEKDITSGLKMLDAEIGCVYECDGTVGSDKVPRAFRIKTQLRENLREDSVKFTFAVRMAIMITFWSFVGDYFELENSKWLVFTSIALVQPYMEGAAEKSKHRIVGTIAGVIIFIILTPLTASEGMVTLLMLAVGYISTVLDPDRYDVEMTFITLCSLLMATTLFPESPLVEERLLYILLGVVCATIANRIILPYRLADETRDLSNRYMSVTRNTIRELRSSLEGKGDCQKSTALMVTSHSLSEKIRMNNDSDPRTSVTELLNGQDLLMESGTYLRNIARSNGLSDHTKRESIALIDLYGPDGKMDIPDDLTTDDEYVNGVAGILRIYRDCRGTAGMVRRFNGI